MGIEAPDQICEKDHNAPWQPCPGIFYMLTSLVELRMDANPGMNPAAGHFAGRRGRAELVSERQKQAYSRGNIEL